MQDIALKQVYGNGWQTFLVAMLLGSAISGLAMLLMSIFDSETWSTDRASMAVLGGAILPLLVAPTCLFKIEVDQHSIRSTFLGWTLQERRRDELADVQQGSSPFALVLRFRDGSRMRLFAINMFEIARISADLHP